MTTRTWLRALTIASTFAMTIVSAGSPVLAAPTPDVPGSLRHRTPGLAPAPRDGLTKALRSGRISQAQYAYQRALATFQPSVATDDFGRTADPGPFDGTLILRDLRLRLDALSPRERRTARTLFSRPDDGEVPTDPEDPKYTVASKVHCFPHVCVHWVESTSDAVRLRDANADGRPDWIDTVGATLENVWTVTVTQNGFRAPKSDLTSIDHGPNGRLDVYLADVPMYGFVTTDDPNSAAGSTYDYWDMSAYMVLDNDFSPNQFDAPNLTGILGLQLGSSHEFFHAVQYAYDYSDAPFYMEGTAAWNEDMVYDSLNTRHSWFDFTNLQHPEYSIDWSKYPETYGAFLFWRFWSEFFSNRFDGSGQALPDPAVIRDLFELNDGAPGGSDYQSIAGAYVYAKREGVLFRDVVSYYHVWNAIPGIPPSGSASTLYEEGRLYPSSPVSRSFTVSAASPSTPSVTELIDHLASSSIEYIPGSEVSSDATLRIALDLPPLTSDIDVSHDPQALAVVSRTAGGPEIYEIALNSSGNGTGDVPFQSGSVSRVVLVLTNASVRYDCSVEDYEYFCHPLDQNDPFIATASLQQASRLRPGGPLDMVTALDGRGQR